RSVERSNDALRRPQIGGEIRSAAEVERNRHETLVHRHLERRVADDPGAIAERLIDRAAERQREILDGVVLVDVEIAVRFHLEVEKAVYRDELEHVVEERQTGRDVVFTRAVEVDADLDARL